VPRNLIVNKSTCISCQLCADNLPAVFRMDRTGLAEVYNSNGTSEDQIEKIVEACPKACILRVEP